MAEAKQKREVYPGEYVSPIHENVDVPDNDGTEHQHKDFRKEIPSNPSPDEK